MQIFKDFKDVRNHIENHPVRGKTHNQWKTNYYYIQDRQYYVYNEEEGKIENALERLHGDRDNVTFRNKLYPILQTWASKFIEKLTLVLSAIPLTQEYDDRVKARNSEQFSKYYWDKGKFKKKLLPGFKWLFISGNLFAKTYFDKTMMAEVEDKNGKTTLKQIGDVDTEILNSFSLIIDPYAKDVSDKNLQYIIEIVTASIPVAEKKYGIKIKNKPVKPEYIDEFMMFQADDWYDENFEFGGVVVVETWEKEDDGTWRNDAWINNEKIKGYSTTGYDTHPYTQAKSDDFGTTYGDTALKHALQMQRDYNKEYGMILDIMQHATPWLVTGYNTEITKGKLEGGGGIEHIKVQGDINDYKFQQGVQINPSLWDGIKSSEMEIQKVLSSNEQGQGRLPSGSSHTPGYIHQALMQADLSKLGAAMVEIESFVADILFKALRLAEKHYEKERVFRIFGKEEGLRVLKLKGNSVGVADIHVDFGSSLPFSKMERVQFLIQLVQAGILDPQTALENFEMGDSIKGIDDTVIDIRKAERNIDDIYLNTSNIEIIEIPNPETGEVTPVMAIKDSKGEYQIADLSTVVPEVSEWDNHELQLSVIEREMKKLKYELSSEVTQKAFQALRQQYVEYIKAKQKEQLQLQQMQMQEQMMAQQGQQQQQQPQQDPQAIVQEILAQLMNGADPDALSQTYPPELVQQAAQIMSQQVQIMQQIQQRAQAGESYDMIIQQGFPPELVEQVFAQMQGG